VSRKVVFGSIVHYYLVELKLPVDEVSLTAFGDPTSYDASASQTSLESYGSSASHPPRAFSLSIDVPGFPRSRPSSGPLGCPQLHPLNLDDKEAVFLPGQTLSVEPPSPLSSHSSVLSEPSFTTSCRPPSIISNVSRVSSSLEVALSTRVSTWLLTDNFRIPTKATMEGMIRYFLLHPVGKLCSSNPHYCKLKQWLMLIVRRRET
jgi:hypothetical protein